MHRSAIMTAVKPTKEAKAASSLAELEAERKDLVKAIAKEQKETGKKITRLEKLDAKITKLKG